MHVSVQAGPVVGRAQGPAPSQPDEPPSPPTFLAELSDKWKVTHLKVRHSGVRWPPGKGLILGCCLSQVRQAPASWDPRERRPAGTWLPESRWPARTSQPLRVTCPCGGPICSSAAVREFCQGFQGSGSRCSHSPAPGVGGGVCSLYPRLPSQEHRKAFQRMWLGFLKHKVGRVGAAAAGSGPLARAVGGVGQAAPRPAPPPSCPSACARRC